MNFKIRAIGALFARYAAVFRESWRIRQTLDPQPRSPDERAFLPAHLELADSPAHPLPLWTMRIIVALAALVCGVALLG